MLVIHTVAGLRPEHGGPSITVPALARAVAKGSAETQVFVLSPATTSAPLDDIDQTNGSITVLYVPYDKLASVVTDLATGAKNTHVVLHDHGQWLRSNRQIASVSRSQLLTRVVSPRGMLSPWAMRHKYWKKKLAWLAYAQRDLRSAKIIHATSDLEANELRELGVSQPIAVIPNGVDDFEVENTVAQKPSRPYFLFMSRVHQKKGIPELLDVWSSLSPLNWELVIAGPDEQNLLTGRKLPSGAKYVGSVLGAEKAKLLGGASVFVLPTHSENFGLVVAESLMAQVPVITTRGAPWQGLIENQCGWWIPMETDSLRDAMLAAIQTPSATLAEMGQRGHQWMKRDFGWPQIGQNMIEVYRWAVGERSTIPPCIQLR